MGSATALTLDPYRAVLAAAPARGGQTSADARLAFLLNWAVLAPSIHNTQPWRFGVHDGVVELRGDPSRALRIVDPAGRELTISCGAALQQLVLAAAREHHGPGVEVLPEGPDAAVLARLVTQRRGAVDPSLVVPGPERAGRWIGAVPDRATSWRAFLPRLVDPSSVAACVRAATGGGAHVRVVAGEDGRARVVGLVADGDRAQFADPAFRRELASWVRPPADPARDGMSGPDHAQVGALASALAPFVLRRFADAEGRAASDTELLGGSPVLAVLCTDGDERRDWLAAGAAFARLGLEAARAGISVGVFGQPCEIPEARDELGRVVGPGAFPQLVVRLGYAPNVPRTPRRPVADVLIEGDPLVSDAAGT